MPRVASLEVLSVIEILCERASLHPDRVALFHGSDRITYGDLWRGITRAAAHFSSLGLLPGERILLAAVSDPNFAYSYFAAHLLGAIAVPIDPALPTPRRNEIVNRAQPALALVMDAAEWTDASCPLLPVSLINELPAEAQRAVRPPTLDTQADLIFTTGTTGRAKGVRLSHRNLAAAARHINAVIGAREDDIEVLPLPLYHSFGLGRLRCVLAAGGAVTLVQGFRLPGEIFNALERHQATALVGVPAGFALLLRFGERGLGRFADRLRYVEIGSAPMPTDQKRALMALLPKTALFMHYGLTEGSRSAFLEFHRYSDQLDTVGTPSPGVRIQIRRDNGGLCTPGERGTIWVTGPHVAIGYWDDPELDARTFVEGWVNTGDTGHLDESGFIRLDGRVDDIINVGGAKVSPDEVERVLVQHPLIAEAACVGISDPRGIAGQVIRAFLVPRTNLPAVSDSELSNWIATQLEPHMIPATYEWVSTLPKTESGKLIRARLRSQSISIQQLPSNQGHP